MRPCLYIQSKDTPRQIQAYRVLLRLPDIAFFLTNWRQEPAPAKGIQLALLRCSGTTPTMSPWYACRRNENSYRRSPSWSFPLWVDNFLLILLQSPLIEADLVLPQTSWVLPSSFSSQATGWGRSTERSCERLTGFLCFWGRGTDIYSIAYQELEEDDEFSLSHASCLICKTCRCWGLISS